MTSSPASSCRKKSALLWALVLCCLFTGPFLSSSAWAQPAGDGDAPEPAATEDNGPAEDVYEEDPDEAGSADDTEPLAGDDEAGDTSPEGNTTEEENTTKEENTTEEENTTKEENTTEDENTTEEADEQPLPRPRGARRGEPWTQDNDSLREQGWEFREQDRSPGSVGCGLWAIIVSLAYRGYGHACAGDTESRDVLLIMEGIAVGLWAAGFTIAVVSNDADSLTPVSSGMYYAGAVLFVSSYLFDLLGTFKGSSRELSPNHRHADGFQPNVMMRLVPTDPFNLTILAGLELPIRYGRFWFVPDAMLDVTALNYWRVAGDLGVKVWTGDSRATYLALGNETRFEQFTGLGFDVLTTVPWVEFSLDIGSLLPHLAGLHFSNRLGYGFEFYSWDSVETDSLFKDQTSLFILESALSLNILDQFNAAITYRQRPDLLIGGLTQSTRIFDLVKVPGAGILGFELDFETENAWKVDFEVNVGTLVEFWLGFGKRF